jgi:hypothetical protein
VNDDIVASVEFLPQTSAIAPAAVGMVRFLPRTSLPFPAIPHDADVNVVGELFGEPEKRLGLGSIHNNKFHGLSRMVNGHAPMTSRWNLPKRKPRTTRAKPAYRV